MAISQYLQTKVILSAQDRGVSALFNKLSGEANATIHTFSRLGEAMTGILGGLTAGFAVKKAIDWIDDYKMSVLSIATTLTDTMRGSGMNLDDVFVKNKRHAEDFFSFLQKQASSSISTVNELMEAYTMMASFGRSLTPTEDSARMLANVVDRIKLATKGQNQEIQVLQELRALLNGQARPSDALSRILKNGNENFHKELQQLILGRGTGNEILEYINKAFANIDIYPYLKKNLSVSLKKLSSNIKIWTIDSFEDIYNDASEYISKIADNVDPNKGNSLLKTSLNGISSSIHNIINSIKSSVDSISSILNSSLLGEKGLGKYINYSKTLAEVLPRLTIMLTTVNLLTKAFSAMKGAMALAFKSMNYTLAGQIATLTALYMTIEDYAKYQKPISYFQNEDINTSTAFNNISSSKTPEDKKQYSWDYLIAQGIALWDAIKAIVATIATDIYKISSLVTQSITYTVTYFTGDIAEMAADFSADIVGAALRAIGSVVQYIIDAATALVKKISIDFEKFITEIRGIFNTISVYALRGVAYIIDLVIKTINNISEALSFVGLGKLSSTGGLSSLIKVTADGMEASFEAYRKKVSEQPSLKLDDILVPEKTSFGKEVYSLISGYFNKESEEGVPGWIGKLKVWGENLKSASGMSLKQLLEEVQFEPFMDTIQNYFNVFQDKREKEYEEHISAIKKTREIQEAISQNTSGNMTKVAQDVDIRNSHEIKDVLKKIGEINKLDKVMSDIESLVLKETPGQNEYSLRLSEIDRTMKELESKIEGSEEASRLLDASTIKLVETFNSSLKIIDDLRLQVKTTDSNTKEHSDAVKKLNEENAKLAALIPELKDALEENTESAKNKAKDSLSTLQKTFAFQQQYNSTMEKLSKEGGLLNALKVGVLEFANTNSSLQNLFNAVQDVKKTKGKGGQDSGLTAGEAFTAWFKGLAMDVFNGIKDVVMKTIDDVKGAISDGLYNLITEGKAKIDEVMDSLLRSITRSITDAIADVVVNQTVSLIGASVMGIFAAKGGVFGGGFTPLKAFSKGGIASRPTIGLVGEAGQNEAIVPLPDGRSIPVRFNGGRENNVIVNVIDNSGSETTKRVENRVSEDGGTVIDIIIDAVSRNRKGIRNVMKSSLGMA